MSLSSVFCVSLSHSSGGAAQRGATWADWCRAAMLTLASKLKRDDGGRTARTSAASDSTHRVSIRDRLLTKGTWARVIHHKLVGWQYTGGFLISNSSLSTFSYSCPNHAIISTVCYHQDWINYSIECNVNNIIMYVIYLHWSYLFCFLLVG